MKATNCDSGLHNWDALGGHCRDCGACDLYLGPHVMCSGKPAGSSQPAKATPVAPAGSGDAAAAPPAQKVPPPRERKIIYGARKDGVWGPMWDDGSPFSQEETMEATARRMEKHTHFTPEG